MKRIVILLIGLMLSASTAKAQWKANRLLATTTAGSVPSACTLLGTVSKNAKELLIFSSLDKGITISTSASCTAAETIEILATTSVVLDVYKDTNTSGVPLYYKYTSAAPTTGSIAISYVTDR